MSIDQAKAFIERMKSDEAFREKVMAAEDVEERLAMIQAEGYDCTAEDSLDFQQPMMMSCKFDGYACGCCTSSYWVYFR